MLHPPATAERSSDPNDAGLFAVSDMSIGFSPAVRHLVTIEVSGAHMAPAVLRAIGQRRAQRTMEG